LAFVGVLGSSAIGAWAIGYTPVAKIVLPADEPDGHAYGLRGVEEKDGFAFLSTRDGELYMFSVRDVPERTPFARYDH
jgi:hypothetical protein